MCETRGSKCRKFPKKHILFINGLRIVTTKYSSHLTFWKAFYFFIEISWGSCLLKPWTNILSQWLRGKNQDITASSAHLCWPFPQDKNKFFSPRTWTPWWFLLHLSKTLTSNNNISSQGKASKASNITFESYSFSVLKFCYCLLGVIYQYGGKKVAFSLMLFDSRSLSLHLKLLFNR